MTPAQKALYWREWGACSRALKAAGKKAGDTERHALQYKALGHNRSSTALTNSEFDKVLAVFRAISRPDDLNAQLRQIDQPETRRVDLQQRALRAALTFASGFDDSHKRQSATRYLDAITKRLEPGAVSFFEASDRTTQKVLGVVEQRVRQLERKAQKLKQVEPTVESEDPF